MKQIIVNTIIVFVISVVLIWGITFNASSDDSYILAISLLLLLHTSLIIALLFKRK
ncbi:hypothetical protein [Cytobacillus sp. NCCP-133]|uniref:hypothetical protein n=1 Tax=Cytobacillus sp. NCCP-133 TaxID=766848 RepID=UPI002230D6CD|nr:hypothetical protein [Cytobacillus sp. NCCP-133]GLB60442.1 hypothetical protein NCCP133_25740 [Cytobacillus sp. NCCP-133]